MIAKQGDNNCVARGLSTMRLALGYDCAIPYGEQANVGSLIQSEILSMCPIWFPDHDTYVFCAKEHADLADDSSDYAGKTCFRNTDDYIIGFSYYVGESKSAHFVVGAPTMYGDMHLAIAVYVVLE